MPLSTIPWWNRLSVMLPAAVAVGTLVLVGSAAALFLRAQEQHLMGEVLRGAALFSETIKSSTYHDMLADRRDSATRPASIAYASSTRKAASRFPATEPKRARWSTSGPSSVTRATRPAGRLNA
jgi:hypothetical protein